MSDLGSIPQKGIRFISFCVFLEFFSHVSFSFTNDLPTCFWNSFDVFYCWKTRKCGGDNYSTAMDVVVLKHLLSSQEPGTLCAWTLEDVADFVGGQSSLTFSSTEKHVLSGVHVTLTGVGRVKFLIDLVTGDEFLLILLDLNLKDHVEFWIGKLHFDRVRIHFRIRQLEIRQSLAPEMQRQNRQNFPPKYGFETWSSWPGWRLFPFGHYGGISMQGFLPLPLRIRACCRSSSLW